jgi:hypothetical protein
MTQEEVAQRHQALRTGRPQLKPVVEDEPQSSLQDRLGKQVRG